MGRLELQMDRSVFGFSHEMKVIHIDLIMYMHFNLRILIMIAFLVSTLYKRK